MAVPLGLAPGAGEGDQPHIDGGQLHFSGRCFSEGKSMWSKVSKASISGARERGEKKKNKQKSQK